MFPEIVQLELPNTDPSETFQMGKSFLFDFQTGDFVLKNGRLVEADKISAIKVWIEKVLRTEKFKFRIYDGTEYGVQLEDLIGMTLPFPFVESEMKREISTALLKHPDIESVSNIVVTREDSLLKVSFDVNLVNSDSFNQEVNF